MPQILIFTHTPYITWVFIHDLVVRVRVLDLKNSTYIPQLVRALHRNRMFDSCLHSNTLVISIYRAQSSDMPKILMFVTMFNRKTYYLTILTLQTFSAQN